MLVTTQYSFQSDAQQINVLPIVVRHLQNGWTIRWGESSGRLTPTLGATTYRSRSLLGKSSKSAISRSTSFSNPSTHPRDCTRGPAAISGESSCCSFPASWVRVLPLHWSLLHRKHHWFGNSIRRKARLSDPRTQRFGARGAPEGLIFAAMAHAGLSAKSPHASRPIFRVQRS